jgi:hypothetical protein
MRFDSWHKGRYIRFKLAVIDPGANFHARMDHRDGSNNFSAIVCSDAVAAAQGCVGAEYAQDSFNSSKTLFCVLHSAQRRRDETSMQIDEPIAPYEQLTGGATRLQGASDVDKTSLIIVDLVRETPVQSLARMIEPLLRVAHPV